MDKKGEKSLAYLRGDASVFEEREKAAEPRKGLGYWVFCPNDRRRRIFWGMVQLLATNSRMRLTKMSQRLGVPISTVFDMLRHVEEVFSFTLALKSDEKHALKQISELSQQILSDEAEAGELPLSSVR